MDRPDTPAHSVPLPGSGGWSLWRWLCVRSAGFPADTVLRLASTDLAQLAERLLDGEPGVEPAHLASVYATEEARTSTVIDEISRDPRFQEALIWQSRDAFENGPAWLLRHPAGYRPSKRRQNEALVARYLQRYCLKNDTIGFFGPVGWGAVSTVGPALQMRPGPALLAHRKVYFEHWAMDAVAERLSADPALRRLLSPRRMPSVRLEGSRLVDAERDEVHELTPLQTSLLEAATGERPAHVIARELQVPSAAGTAEADVLRTLDEMAQRGWIIWRLEVPLLQSEPDRWLRTAIERLQDTGARTAALGALAELQHARDDVRRAAGDPPALLGSLRRIDDTFTRVTGVSATRHAGQMYAGRTIIYEDCLRDLELTVGPALLDRIGPPLGLLLQSARWFTHALAARFRTTLRSVFETLGGKPDASVDLLAFRRGLDRPLDVASTTAELSARWARILGLSPDVRSVNRSAREIAAGVAEAFPAPCPGWSTARLHSPDLLLAAASAEHAARGDCLVVVGEIHTAMSTVTNNCLMEHLAERDALVQARERDVGVSVVPVPKRGRAGVRVLTLSPSRLDYDLEDGDSPSWRPRDRVLAAADLIVCDDGGRLRVRSRQGGLDFDAVEFFWVRLTGASVQQFRMAPEWRHCPRITVDGVVFAREAWTFSPDELAFARVRDRSDRFLEVHRWAREHGIPRFSFARVPKELKPWFVDLNSIISVEELVRSLRTTDRVTLTEMLPTMEQLWLADAEDRRYASELRLVAVDPQRCRPAD